MSSELGPSVAVYTRRSTDDQNEEHQSEDIREWLERRDHTLGDVEVYREGAASGASAARDAFDDLLDAVLGGELTDVVVWEISRIARKGAIAQEFFDACEDHCVTIHITNGSVREVRPDGTGRLVADIVASVAAEERRALMRRTRSGLRQAREAGKWLGEVPLGFSRADGYLVPTLDPDYEDGDTGFLDVVDALERIDAGASYRATAENTPNVTRQTLSNIDSDPERRAWYLEGEADDDRVDAALGEVTIPDDVEIKDAEERWDPPGARVINTDTGDE